MAGRCNAPNCAGDPDQGLSERGHCLGNADECDGRQRRRQGGLACKPTGAAVLFKKWRRMMADWVEFLAQPEVKANVVPMQGRRA
jgi:hypothetical protein